MDFLVRCSGTCRIFCWVGRLMAGLAPPERNTSVRFRLYPLMKNLILPKNLISKIHPSTKALDGLISGAKRPLKLLYGETYDLFGITVDSLKYYFFVAILAQKLKGEATVLIADRASILNESAADKAGLVDEGERRLEQCKIINQKYNLNIDFRLMSEYVKDKKFTLKEIRDKKVLNLLKKTVLQNKIRQEIEMGFQYALEAIEIAGDFDIKIGPPREIYYDMAAKLLGYSYYGIYLKPTYPLGQNFLFYLQNPEIEKFGLTPYKAGSNKMQDFRLVYGKTTLEELKSLLVGTEIDTDLIDICLMAKNLLAKKYEFPSGSGDALKLYGEVDFYE